jgi:hypothetical protein
MPRSATSRWSGACRREPEVEIMFGSLEAVASEAAEKQIRPLAP